MQSPSSFTSKGYLDGNFIRTSLLYATYKTQGIGPEPWREDTYLGAAYDKSEKVLYVYLNSPTPWEGVLKFDLPRHQTILNLPFNYPRLNTTPEWFVVNIQKTYTVVDLKTGKETLNSGQALADGFQISLDEKNSPLFLKISEK